MKASGRRSVRDSCPSKSLVSESNTPSGKNSSGPNELMVPVNPLGVIPTIVKKRSLTRSSRPSSPGSKPVRRQYECEATATWTSLPGRPSSAVNERPRASFTPSTSK